jgi:hypothetical protein
MNWLTICSAEQTAERMLHFSIFSMLVLLVLAIVQVTLRNLMYLLQWVLCLQWGVLDVCLCL